MLAGIGHVEGELAALRVEDERELVDLLHCSNKHLVLTLGILLILLHDGFLLLVLELKLGTEHVDGLSKVSLFENGIALCDSREQENHQQ